MCVQSIISQIDMTPQMWKNKKPVSQKFSLIKNFEKNNQRKMLTDVVSNHLGKFISPATPADIVK